MCKKYCVTITETLRMTVEVEADAPNEAEQIIADVWRDGKYILDADNFVSVDFAAVPVTREQN